MKKIITLFAFIALTFACSSDDDAPKSEEQTNEQKRELIINGSPWYFTSATVIEVGFNPANLTKAEVENIINRDYEDSELRFSADGSGLLVLDGFDFDFTWGLNSAGNEIVLGGQLGTFTGLSVKPNELLFTMAETCHSVNPDADVCAEARFKFN